MEHTHMIETLNLQIQVKVYMVYEAYKHAVKFTVVPAV